MSKAKQPAPIALPKKGGSYVIGKDGGKPQRKHFTKPAPARSDAKASGRAPATDAKQEG